MSTRQEIIDKIVEVMTTVTDFQNVGDFETNWGQDELPALSVFDSVANFTLANNEPEAFSQTNVLRVSLQVFIKSGQRAAEVRDLILQVTEKIRDNRTWNDLAMWTVPVSSSLLVRQDAATGSFDLIGGNVEIDIYTNSASFEF